MFVCYFVWMNMRIKMRYILSACNLAVRSQHTQLPFASAPKTWNMIFAHISGLLIAIWYNLKMIAILYQFDISGFAPRFPINHTEHLVFFLYKKDIFFCRSEQMDRIYDGINELWAMAIVLIEQFQPNSMSYRVTGRFDVFICCIISTQFEIENEKALDSY